MSETEVDVRRPGRRHPRGGGVASLRRSPPLRTPGRRGRARASGSRSWCRRSSCWPGTRCGCILCGPTRSSLRWPRIPRWCLSVAGDWAFIPSAWKAIDGEDPALGYPDDVLRRRAADRDRLRARRAQRARQGGGDPAPPARRLPTGRRRGRSGRGPRGQVARDPGHRGAGGTGAGQVQVRRQRRRRRTGGPWWSICGLAAGRTTTWRPTTRCAGSNRTAEVRTVEVRPVRCGRLAARSRAARSTATTASSVRRAREATPRPWPDWPVSGPFPVPHARCCDRPWRGPRWRTRACAGPPRIR